ncbi:MAG: hypothetical protein AAF367_05410 [Pseudomonadota bacterium]
MSDRPYGLNGARDVIHLRRRDVADKRPPPSSREFSAQAVRASGEWDDAKDG